jgi:hypothetical protein
MVKLTKTIGKKKEEGGWLRRSNIGGVNLIKAHCMHVINITMNPLVQLIYTNKNFLKIK